MFLMFSSACVCTKCNCKTRKRYKNYLYYKIATYWKIILNNSFLHQLTFILWYSNTKSVNLYMKLYRFCNFLSTLCLLLLKFAENVLFVEKKITSVFISYINTFKNLFYIIL